MHFSLYLLQYQKERLKGEVRGKKGPCQKRVWGNKDCGRNADTETRGVKAREESQRTEMRGQENRGGKRRDKDKRRGTKYCIRKDAICKPGMRS